MLDKEKTWIDYVTVLSRLDKTVNEQTCALEKKDFKKLSVLFGQKENAFLSLQMVANRLSKLEETKELKNYTENKSKAKNLIQSIQEIEAYNKNLLVELMTEIKKQSKDLTDYSDKCKTYLSSIRVKQDKKVNIVS